MKKRIMYQEGTSVLHRLHPLVKVAWLVFGTLVVFIVRSPWTIAVTLAAISLIILTNKLPILKVRGTWLFFSTALTLGALQVLFYRAGEIILQIGPVSITTGGLQTGSYVAGRFLSVVCLSYIFVLSTDPNDLAYALMKAGLPYRYGFALVTALRLVPVFEQEGQVVYHAQLARGAQYDIDSPRRFLTLARQFFLPMLVSALDKVDALAISMEGRCFGKYPKRTFLRQVSTSHLDIIALVLLGLSIILTFVSFF